MSPIQLRVASLIIAVAATSSPLLAQQRDAAATLAPHIREHLWPTRPLSPAEQELKDHVIVLRDSLAILDGAAALLERQARGRAGIAVMRSSARTLVKNCATGVRASEVMRQFSLGLSTDNQRWGEPAVKSYRASVVALKQAMTTCETDVARDLAKEGGPTPAAVVEAAGAARLAVAKYTRAVDDLIRTLNLPVDPRISGRSGR